MYKKYKLILVLILLTSTTFAKTLEEVKKESTFDYISHEVYCFFASCKTDLIQKNYTINNDKKDNNFVEKNKKDRGENKNTSPAFSNSEKEQNEKIRVIDRTKYINQGKTIVKKYYNTVEKTPIINKTYPKEVIQKTERVVEEYDDSSLKKQIRNNRRLISQVSSVTDADNLSDNKLNDLGDVDVASASVGQILS